MKLEHSGKNWTSSDATTEQRPNDLIRIMNVPDP